MDTTELIGVAVTGVVGSGGIAHGVGRWFARHVDQLRQDSVQSRLDNANALNRVVDAFRAELAAERAERGVERIEFAKSLADVVTRTDSARLAQDARLDAISAAVSQNNADLLALVRDLTGAVKRSSASYRKDPPA